MQKTNPESEQSWNFNVADINTDTYDLSVENPNTPEEVPLRTPSEILKEMKVLDRDTNEILGFIEELI
jgi:type I restriction enzyme M protein